MVANADSIGRDLTAQFYKAFEKRDLESVVGLFTHDAVIEVGASGSHTSVTYGGVMRGADAIRDFYRRRFAREGHDFAPVRPYCGFEPPHIHWPWIIVMGAIKDQLRDGSIVYDGRFVHVWTVDPSGKKFSALAMFLEQTGRASPQS